VIFAIIPVFFTIALLVGAIMAHRGKSFWGTWAMMGGAAAFLLGTVAMLGISLGVSLSGDAYRNFLAMIPIAGFACFGGFLAYLVGLLALCARWGRMASRAEELESLTESLIQERDGDRVPSEVR
jgi:hypothetical protein